jgi:hypothetical protein
LNELNEIEEHSFTPQGGTEGAAWGLRLFVFQEGKNR